MRRRRSLEGFTARDGDSERQRAKLGRESKSRTLRLSLCADEIATWLRFRLVSMNGEDARMSLEAGKVKDPFREMDELLVVDGLRLGLGERDDVDPNPPPSLYVKSAQAGLGRSELNPESEYNVPKAVASPRGLSFMHMSLCRCAMRMAPVSSYTLLYRNETMCRPIFSVGVAWLHRTVEVYEERPPLLAETIPLTLLRRSPRRCSSWNDTRSIEADLRQGHRRSR